LCEAIGKRLSSIFGASLIYDTLDNRVRPTRGITASLNTDVAGLGGDVSYVRLRANASKFMSLGKGFVFSLTGEGGAIKSLNGDDIRLTDRFYLGEPQIGGFDIRGVGPRVVRKPYVDASGNIVNDATADMLLSKKRSQWTDDALGGKYYYLATAELEIPLGSGARELGLRPSIFVNAGSVWGSGFDPRKLDGSTTQIFIPQRDNAGIPQYNVTCNGSSSVVSSPTAPAKPPTCTGAEDGVTALGFPVGAFKEFYLGDTWKPRVSVGIGVNWNSPFGPFRINFSKVLVKQDGDDTKAFNFNVGTQF
jgi:outer membrane protein insertion porin family